MVPSRAQAGFTLIELLVALSIFTVVVTMSTGTLLVLIDANAKAQNIQAVMNNLTFALDSMTREIRTGFGYYCNTSAPPNYNNSLAPRDCASGGTFLSIIEGGNSLTAGLPSNRITFFFSPNEFGTGHGAIMRRLSNGTAFPFTSENVRVTNLDFVVTGTTSGLADPTQPTVTIYIEGSAGELNGLESDFNIQASVVQRILDI